MVKCKGKMNWSNSRPTNVNCIRIWLLVYSNCSKVKERCHLRTQHQLALVFFKLIRSNLGWIRKFRRRKGIRHRINRIQVVPLESLQTQINLSIPKTLEQFSLAIGSTMIERAILLQRFNAVFLVMPFHHLEAINKLSPKFLPSAMPTNQEIIPTIIVKHLIQSVIPWAVKHR